MIKTSFLGLLAPLVGLCPLLGAQSVLQNQTGSDGLLGVDDAAITPDGRLIVVRDNTGVTSSRVYDAQTGAQLAVHFPTGSGGGISGVAHDAVAVTNSRAVVLGTRCQILDLVAPGTAPLADMDVGYKPRDLEITPDGTMVAIRGGRSLIGLQGGLYVFDLASATQLVHAPGEPLPWTPATTEFDVDSVAVSNEHAAFISTVGLIGTRVTIMDLHPPGGGPPAVVYETGSGADIDLIGTPHDIAMTPDGQHVAVRSELAVALFRLNGSSTNMVWIRRLHGDPGPFGFSAMDSVEVTNERIATISRFSNGSYGAQVDIFDLAGNQQFEVISGDPHDLAITPSGRRLVVRTHTHVYLYDLQSTSGGENIHFLDRRPQLSSHTSYGAGMDSLQVTEEKAVSVARMDETADIRIWDITGGELQLLKFHLMPERPVDLVITPAEAKVVISGFSRVLVFDLQTNGLLMDFDSNAGGGYPWCDGVVANDQTAIAMGSMTNGLPGSPAGGGWLTIVDLFDQPSVYCTSNANSTGDVAQIYATGSASVAGNNLRLVANDLPRAHFGVFVFGDGQLNAPFGNGVLCVGGQAAYFPPQLVATGGVAELLLDSTNLPPGSPVLSIGSTGNFQFLFRDPTLGPGQMNSTGGLEVLFTP